MFDRVDQVTYDLDKSLYSNYDKVYSLKRSRKDKDKDEDPFAGSDRWLKKRNTSKGYSDMSQDQKENLAYLARKQLYSSEQNHTSCEICNGPHDTQYCMEDPEQAFVEYASSRTDEAGDARLSKFEADFEQQQSNMTNKIDTMLKAIIDRIAGTLPSDTVKNPKLSTYLALSARSYTTEDPQCSTQTHDLIHTITIHTEQQSASYDDGEKENKEEEDDPENINVNPFTPPNPSITFITEKVLKFNSFFESLGLVPLSSNTELICTKEEDDDVIYIKIVPKDDNSCKEGPKA
ncbi:hypothetical protein Tco_0369998 [Tanacetum coccineum]